MNTYGTYYTVQYMDAHSCECLVIVREGHDLHFNVSMHI